MTRLKNAQDLTHLRETLQKDLQAKKAAETIIYIGMGTCGLSASSSKQSRPEVGCGDACPPPP